MTLTAGALRADPGFRRYLAARVISTVGTLVTAVVLPVLVYRLTWSVTWTAAVVVLQALPHLLLAPVAASVAARVDRRKLLFAADLAGGALLVSIPLAWWYEVLSGWHVLAVAGAVQVVFLFFDAAHHRALPSLVGPESAPAGGTALRNATGLAELMLPPLAGLAVTVVAPAPLLALDAVSFLASALLVRAALRSRPGTGDAPVPTAPRVRIGLRFLRRRARSLALAGMLHAAAAAAYLAVLLPWADQHLGVPPFGDARLALVVSCWGLGVIVGRALAGPLIQHVGSAQLAKKALIVSTACAVAVVMASHWLPAVLGCLLWGTAHTVAAKAMNEALGRAGLGSRAQPAARVMWRGAGPVIGAVLAGTVAAGFGARAGLATSVALLALATVAAAAFAATRRGATPLPSGSAPAGLGLSHSAHQDEPPRPSTLADRAGDGNGVRDRQSPRTSVP